MKFILYKSKFILLKISYLFNRVINLFRFTPEQGFNIALRCIRIVSFIFLLHLLYTYLISTIEFIAGQRGTDYLLFTIGDLIWFLSDKLLLFFLFFTLYHCLRFLYKNFEQLEYECFTLKQEILAITIFCAVRVVWQIVEMFNAPLANNGTVMLFLGMCTAVSLPYLSLYRILLYVEKKEK